MENEISIELKVAMEKFTFGIAAGICSTLFWPFLPPIWIALSLVVIAMGLYRRQVFVSSICLGIGWAICFFALSTQWLTDEKVDPSISHSVHITVKDVSLKKGKQQILAQVTQINGHHYWINPKVRLSVPISEKFAPNDQLDAKVKLQLPHRLNNPGSFNSVRWLLGKGITATGKIVSISQHQHAGDSWRDHWMQQTKKLTHGLSSEGLIMALIFGEQTDVDDNEWQLLRNHGLIHLMAISGMHIGLVAWLGMALTRLLLSPFGGFPPSWYWLPGIALAGCYSALANFSVPTVRAFIMIILFVGLKVWKREWSGTRIWFSVFSLLLIVDPWTIFSTGFWLSFIAVAAIVFASFLWKKPSAIRLQIFMTSALLPFQLFLFNGVSITSVFINLVAGPWFTLSIIPCVIVGGFLVPVWPSFAKLLFVITDWQLVHLLQLLEMISCWFSGWLSFSLTQIVVLLWLLIAITGLYFFPQIRKNALVWLGGLGCVFAGFDDAIDWRIDFIDVGQGLSVLVTQGKQGLLFDTGDAYPGGFNMADAAVFPVMQYRGVTKLDYLFISHKDKDHAANWEKIFTRFPDTHLISSAKLNINTTICQKNMMWRWDALLIHVLSPIQSSGGERNEDSCVIRITDGKYSVLLTGDMEKQAEKQIAEIADALVQSDLMSSPHHGSRSSSTDALIEKINPQFVIHSAGYFNRWHHPHAEIVERYAKHDVKQFNTAVDGLVTVSFADGAFNIHTDKTYQPWYENLDTWLVSEHPLK